MDTPKKCNFEKTSRGFPELLDENRYRYQKTSKVLKSGASKWLCKENRNPLVKCNAYAVVTGDEFVIKGFHLHGTAKQEAKAIEKSVIRTAAENTAISSRSALGDITNMMVASPSTSENFMTSKETIARQIRRERAKSQSRPVVPKDYDDLLSIPMKFQRTADNSTFLRKSQFVGSDEFLMLFCSDTGKHILASYPDWAMDGTFSTAPDLFTQV